MRSPNETVTLPTLSSGSTGNYNGVVIADSPTDYAAGQFTALDAYESAFGVRQVDGYMFPNPNLGVTFNGISGSLDGTTGTLTAAGLAAFPELKGPIPFDNGSFGYGATVNTGAPYTPVPRPNSFRPDVMAGIYQHPTDATSNDPQAGVSELALNFNYNASQLQWLLLAPELINWVTQDTHLGLFRNYFGQDIDDLFIADNEWSQQYQCTPAATDPPDYNCPTAVQNATAGSGPGIPADVEMSAADVDYVVNWEKQTGITLNLAFNAIGACTAPSADVESSANCTGSVTDPSGTYTDPGQVVDTDYPNDQAFVNELLAHQADFNWITHTWSHQFLGCNVWAAQPLTSVTVGSGGSLAAGTYNYEITAATAYGESEPSTAQTVTVGDSGSATLTWPEAPNGTGHGRQYPGADAGPAAGQASAAATPRPGATTSTARTRASTTFGLVGHVAENPNATSSTTYSFTDNGSTSPGAAPGSGPDFPSATDPGIDCASAAGQLGAGHQHPGRFLDRPGNRHGPGVRRGQQADQLRPVRRGDRRALRPGEPQHGGRLRRRGHQDLRPGRLPPAHPVLPRRRDRCPPLPEQHLLQRHQLARRDQRVQHAVRGRGRPDRRH